VHTGKIDPSHVNNTARANAHRSKSEPAAPVSYTSLHSNLVLRMPAQPCSGSHAHARLTEPSERSLYFFDASHQTGPNKSKVSLLGFMALSY
jgi:hypothetical protein